MLSFKNLASFTLFATLASFTAAAAVVEQRSSQVTVSAYAQENCQAVPGAPDNTSSWSTTIYDNGDDCTNVGPNQPIGFDTGSISAGGKGCTVKVWSGLECKGKNADIPLGNGCNSRKFASVSYSCGG